MKQGMLALVIVGLMGITWEAIAQQRQETDKEQLFRALAQLQSCTASLNAAQQSAGDLGVQLQRAQERIQQLEAEKATAEKAKASEGKPPEESAK